MPDWLAHPAGAASEPVEALPPEPLAVPRASERVIDRARALAAAGQLHQAARALEAISFADPLRPDADRLRAEVQRRLLEGAR